MVTCTLCAHTIFSVSNERGDVRVCAFYLRFPLAHLPPPSIRLQWLYYIISFTICIWYLYTNARGVGGPISQSVPGHVLPSLWHSASPETTLVDLVLYIREQAVIFFFSIYYYSCLFRFNSTSVWQWRVYAIWINNYVVVLAYITSAISRQAI